MFRNVAGCYCLYEPLHERLLPWLIWPPRTYEGHAFVGDYFTEYKGFSAIPELFDPSWGVSRLRIEPNESADPLFRYLSYLIGTAFGRAPRVVLKDNRFTFRLGWLRTRFPAARIVHIYRDPADHWQSIVRRVQDHLGREDVGQDSVDFMGFRLGAWCDDLAPSFPELAAEQSDSGYERFLKLSRLSRQEHERYADVSIELAELKSDFVETCKRISEAVGFEVDGEQLRPLLATGPARGDRRGELRRRLDALADRAGARYAEARVARRQRVLS
jgi:hypothetical protein